MNDLEGRTARRALSGKQIGAIDEEVDHFVRFVVVEENHRALTALASQQLGILLQSGRDTRKRKVRREEEEEVVEPYGIVADREVEDEEVLCCCC